MSVTSPPSLTVPATTTAATAANASSPAVVPHTDEAFNRLKLYFQQQRTQQELSQESQVVPSSEGEFSDQSIKAGESASRAVTPLQAFDSFLQYFQSLH